MISVRWWNGLSGWGGGWGALWWWGSLTDAHPDWSISWGICWRTPISEFKGSHRIIPQFDRRGPNSKSFPWSKIRHGDAIELILIFNCIPAVFTHSSFACFPLSGILAVTCLIVLFRWPVRNLFCHFHFYSAQQGFRFRFPKRVFRFQLFPVSASVAKRFFSFPVISVISVSGPKRVFWFLQTDFPASPHGFFGFRKRFLCGFRERFFVFFGSSVRPHGFSRFSVSAATQNGISGFPFSGKNGFPMGC